jgi:hypothetical protein
MDWAWFSMKVHLISLTFLNFLFNYKAAKAHLKLMNFKLSDIMNSWTKQSGYPLITVERIDSYNIKVSQKQFLLDPQSSTLMFRWEILWHSN